MTDLACQFVVVGSGLSVSPKALIIVFGNVSSLPVDEFKQFRRVCGTFLVRHWWGTAFKLIEFFGPLVGICPKLFKFSRLICSTFRDLSLFLCCASFSKSDFRAIQKVEKDQRPARFQTHWTWYSSRLQSGKECIEEWS